MEFKKVTCYGTGLIGGSWSTLFALKDIEVTLYDIVEGVAKDAVKRAEIDLNMLNQEGLITLDMKRKAMGNLHIASTIEESVENVEYIQESVFEDYSLKKEVYSKLDALLSPDVIIASSSSGLLMSEIQKIMNKPERCIIAHPWNPPLIIPLVEIVPGKKTSENTLDKTKRFMTDIGKVPVILKKEVPGFIGNRLSAALWREAINLLMDGVASSEDIDKALSAGPGLRWALMGSFMTYHLGGGKGGIKRFIEGIGKTFTGYWETMDNWDSIPEEAVDKMIAEMNKLADEKKIVEVSQWRDKKILQLLKILYPETL